MTAAELREKIRMLVPTLVGMRKQAEEAAVEYDELTKFPELKSVIVDLLTYEFDNFIASIDWVAPCLLYTSPSPRDRQKSRMPSSA